MKILSSLTTALGSVIHVVEAPFEEAGKLGTLFETAAKDTPALKAAALQLVALAEKVGADAGTDASASGLNVSSDVQTFTDIAALYTYVKATLVPLIKQVYGDVKADFAGQDSTATQTSVTVSSTMEAQKGPGLHTVVPA